jgi:hypothetical protein
MEAIYRTEVMHKRVAGLDVHKATVVSCARLMRGRRQAGVSDFRDDDGGAAGPAGVVDGVPVHACHDGGNGGLLDAGMADPERG